MEKRSIFLAEMEGWISTFTNLFLFILKYWAGIITGSIALIADAWHTLSDSISSVIVIITMRYKKKPADGDHPFGHGRVELISALIIGVFLVVIGFNFILESIAILRLKSSANFGLVAIIVTIISILGKEGLARYALWSAKKISSKTIHADAWHHRSDALSSLIILIGIFFGTYFWWIDGVLGIIVAMFIFYAAYDILAGAINPLIGEIPDQELITSIKNICAKEINIEVNIHNFHMHRYGDHTELTFHIKMPGEYSLEKAHTVATKLEKLIKNELNIEPTIHMEPFA